MLRIKLVLLLTVLLGALVAVALALTTQVSDELLVDAEEQLKSSNEVVRLAASVHGYSVLAEAASAASAPGVAAGLACPATAEELAAAAGSDSAAGSPPAPSPNACTTTRHEAVLAALSDWSRQRAGARQNNQHRYLSERDPGFALPRQPDLLVASDANGVVVARVGFDKDDWYGESRPNMADFAAVARTELGTPEQDLVVWREHAEAAPQLVRVGAAPIRDPRGRFVGAVTVGYFITDSAAEEAIQLLYDIDVAYFYRGTGDSVSFGGTTASGRPQFLDAVANATFHGPGGTTVGFSDVALRNTGVVYAFENDGSDWMVISTALASDAAGDGVQAGFIVVRSASEAVAPLDRFRGILPLLAVSFLLLGTLGVLVVIREFMVPIEDISKGVQEVIAGNRDYMWEVDEHSHLSDLAHSLNVMSARLQGKKDPDAEDAEGEDDWKAMAGNARTRRSSIAQGLAGLRSRSESSDRERS